MSVWEDEGEANGYDVELFAYGLLRGQRKHFCPDWDFMAIDESCREFEACTCSHYRRTP